MVTDLQWISILVKIIIIILLLCLNALICMSEISIISLDRNKLIELSKNEDNKSIRILKISEDKESFLYSFQIFMTLCIASISYIIFNTIYDYSKGNVAIFIVSTIIFTYLFVLLGYILPKKYSIKNSEKIAYKYLSFISIVVVLLKPFTKVILFTVSLFMKNSEEDNIDLDNDLDTFIVNDDLINNNEKLDNEELFEDKKVEKVMTPRTQVYCIDINEPLEDYLDEMLEKRFSRIPIYENNIDNIIGVLYIKDFYIEAKNKGINNIDIKEIMMEPYFIPEVNRVKDVFYDLQNAKKQMAIIIDEYGGFSGIVTIEDLVEEIMGEIDDEYHESAAGIEIIGKNTFLVSGITTLEEINEVLNINLESTTIDTISGYLINLIGNIPVNEEEKIIKEENIEFRIKEVSEKTIDKVIINLINYNK